MLFNSHQFIFIFFPIVFFGFFLIATYQRLAATIWLALASLFFYGYWSPKALPLLLGSICINYWFGTILAAQPASATASIRSDSLLRRQRLILFAAIAINLCVLGYFKYINFFIDTANYLLHDMRFEKISILNIILPIGISFFTFTQIAYLVDCAQGKVKERKFSHYLLFVTYFPHLIAGPVLHHGQMMPQFAKPETYRIDINKVRIGLIIFIIGLAKKILLADPLGEYSSILFDNHLKNVDPAFFVAWFGVLAYTFQIYFDFSGYSDMAVGLSLFFNIQLPINFNSPYQATSIIDFWHRWHISLSIFLRDYLYIPLGGNRKGVIRRYFNLFITMLLGGLWHGANWTFVLWGAAHGILLTANHGWRWLVGGRFDNNWVSKTVSWAVTFLSICATWVLFRATNIDSAYAVYRGMLGFNGVSIPASFAERFPGLQSVVGIKFDGLWQINLSGSMATSTFFVTLLTAAITALLFPNAMRLTSMKYLPSTTWQRWSGLVFGVLFSFLVFSLNRPSPFLYFQF